MSKYKLKQKIYIVAILSLTTLIVYFSGKTIQINLEKFAQFNYKQQVHQCLQESNPIAQNKIIRTIQPKLSPNLLIKINSAPYYNGKTKINDNNKYIIAEILGNTHL